MQLKIAPKVNTRISKKKDFQVKENSRKGNTVARTVSQQR